MQNHSFLKLAVSTLVLMSACTTSSGNLSEGTRVLGYSLQCFVAHDGGSTPDLSAPVTLFNICGTLQRKAKIIDEELWAIELEDPYAKMIVFCSAPRGGLSRFDDKLCPPDGVIFR